MVKWIGYALLVLVVLFSTPTNAAPTEIHHSRPLSGWSQGAGPSGSPSDYTGIDLLFIVDQSGSMGGVAFKSCNPDVIATDPDGFRFDGPQYAIEWLSVYLQSAVKADDLRIRIAHLAFGSYPVLQMNWVPLAETSSGTRLDPVLWEAKLAEILNDLSVSRFGFASLCNTDFLKAVEEGRLIFERTDPLVSDQNHVRAVIILTDGAPCVTAACDLPFAQTHLAEVQQVLQQYYPAPNYQIYLVAMNSDAEWANLGGLWQQTICTIGRRCTNLNVQQIGSLAEMPDAFNQILIDLVSFVQPPKVIRIPVTPPDSVGIPPFQDLMRVNIFKTSNNPMSGNLTIQDPTSTTVTGKPALGTDKLIEVHVFNDPTPGDWFINISDPNSYTGVVIDRTLSSVEMDIPSNAVGFSPVPLVFRVLNASGNTLNRYANNYALTVRADVYDAHDPNNPVFLESVNLVDDPAIAVYEFKGTWNPLTYYGPVEVRVDAFFEYPVGSGIYEYLVQGTPLTEFEVREGYIQNRGPQQSNLLEDEILKLQADVRDKTTNQPIMDFGDLGIVVEIENSTGTRQPPLVLANSGVVSGSIESALDLPNPDVYKITSSVIQRFNDGTYKVIPNTTRTDTVTIRPINYLTVKAFFVPNDDEVDAKQNRVMELFPNTKFEVRVEVRDKDNNLVSLESITNGAETIPQLQIFKGNKPIDLEVDLQPLIGQQGVYTFTTNKLGTGEYTARASVVTGNDGLAGDYRWQQPIGTDSIKRTLPMFVVLWIGGGVALAFAIIGIGVLGTLGYHWLRTPPLSGEIILYERSRDAVRNRTITQEVARISLSKPQRHKRKLKGLPAPFKSMIVTNKRDNNYVKSGDILIKDLKLTSEKPTSPTQRVKMRDHVVVYTDDAQVEYIIAKDADLTIRSW